MEAYVTVKFLIKHLISYDELDQKYCGDLYTCVENTIKNEGLFGIVEEDFEILGVKPGDA